LQELFGDEDDFMDFINSFGKNYFDLDDHNEKKNNFIENNKQIKKHNE